MPPGIGQRQRRVLPSPRESHGAGTHARSGLALESADGERPEPPVSDPAGLENPGVARGRVPPRHAEHARTITPRRARRSMSGMSGHPSSSTPSRPARNTTSTGSFTAQPGCGTAIAVPSLKVSSLEQVGSSSAGVGIDAIMVYTEPLRNPGPGQMQPGLSVSHEFTPDDRNGFSRPC